MSSSPASPVENLTYDLISALHNKLEAVTAYQKYMQDAQGDQKCQQLFQQLLEDDKKHARMLQQELSRHLSGK